MLGVLGLDFLLDDGGVDSLFFKLFLVFLAGESKITGEALVAWSFVFDREGEDDESLLLGVMEVVRSS